MIGAILFGELVAVAAIVVPLLAVAIWHVSGWANVCNPWHSGATADWSPMAEMGPETWRRVPRARAGKANRVRPVRS